MAESKLSETGLARVEYLYENRNKRALELKENGKKIISYLCCLIPVELITALDLVPYRILGDIDEPITQADTYLETIMCPFIRSCFDLALKGKFDFVDGLVMPHACDAIVKVGEVWPHYHKPEYTHFLNVPHMVYPSSFEFFQNEIKEFQKTLEDFAGRKISTKDLQQAIQLHNENRALLRELYSLRKQSPPLISGTETMKLLVVGTSIPVTEYNELIKAVIAEAKGRKYDTQKEPARILIYGGEIDDAAFIELVEKSGANVVVDDICLGTRGFRHDIDSNTDPITALARHYLADIQCPRTFRPKEGLTHKQDLDNRFGHLHDYVKEFNVNGVILYIIRFCDTFELDAPDVRDYLRDMGLPVLHLEDDYSVTTIGQLSTRVQAFLEMIA